MTPFDKKFLLEQVIQKLESQWQLLVNAAKEAKEYSTAEDSKAENKYDTRGLEASYLASGQSMRAQKIQEQIYILNKVKIVEFAKTDSIGMTALIKVMVNEKQSKVFFVLPVGGVDLEVKGEKVQTIALDSPIGQSLYQQKVGYEFDLNERDYEILEIQ